jgi:hypothetical protein
MSNLPGATYEPLSSLVVGLPFVPPVVVGVIVGFDEGIAFSVGGWQVEKMHLNHD